MAIVRLNTIGSMYGSFAETEMPSPIISGWTYAAIGETGGTISAGGPSTPTQAYAGMSLTGTGLWIDPNVLAFPVSGPALSERAAGGVVTGFSYTHGIDSHTTATYYTITGISVAFQDFVANGDHLLDFVLSGNDTIYGTDGNDHMQSYGGNDRLYGGNGDDVAFGGDGNDILYGQAGNDWLYGDAGNDTLVGGAGLNNLLGGEGYDRYVGGTGTDSFYDEGLSGIDTADYRASNAAVNVDLLSGTGAGGHAEGDSYFGIERVWGSAHDDTMTGSQKLDYLHGFDGNDTFYGLGGNDRVYGGNGDDVAFGGDGVDFLYGEAGDDFLSGDAGNDRLYGGDGNDFIAGGDGADLIYGDAGNDFMDGGAGNDFFVLGPGDDGLWLGAGRDLVRFDYGNGQDTIFDFNPAQDRIDFTHTDMTLAALQANAYQTETGVLFGFGSGSILLAGVDLAAIDWSADFLFA